jgi:SAM-dependent methyltransferase
MTQSEETPAAMPVWYTTNPTEDNLAPAMREVLVRYSGIPPNEVLDHVVKIRNEAWKVFPYPCIGQFRFVEPGFTHLSKEFDESIQRLRKGEKFLDMACCFGHAIRELVHGGAPAENIYGCDLKPDFIELGYKLFQDRDKLSSKFITADIFDPNSALAQYKGYFDIIHAGKFFHLWGYDTQLVVSKAVLELLRPQPGSMIIGSQIGATEAGEEQSPTGTMFRHNPESLREMWEKIGKELGIKFTVEARLSELTKDHFRFVTGKTRMIWFAIRRE